MLENGQRKSDLDFLPNKQYRWRSQKGVDVPKIFFRHHNRRGYNHYYWADNHVSALENLRPFVSWR